MMYFNFLPSLSSLYFVMHSGETETLVVERKRTSDGEHAEGRSLAWREKSCGQGMLGGGGR